MKDSLKKQEAEFLKIVQNTNTFFMSAFNKNFIELYSRAPYDKRIKLFEALPETVENIKWYWRNQIEEEKKKELDNENLIFILKEYISSHNDSCDKCLFAKRLLEDLKHEDEPY